MIEVAVVVVVLGLLVERFITERRWHGERMDLVAAAKSRTPFEVTQITRDPVEREPREPREPMVGL